ncbi:Alpha-soluble NSF attachment protein [Dirofilaria immitis]
MRVVSELKKEKASNAGELREVTTTIINEVGEKLISGFDEPYIVFIFFLMAENETKARKKLEDAEKKAKGGSGFFSGLFGNAKAEEAADLFVQAGNLFKISKLWREAGDAFVRSAEIHAAATDRKHDAASNFAEAANCYRKVNPQVNFPY